MFAFREVVKHIESHNLWKLLIKKDKIKADNVPNKPVFAQNSTVFAQNTKIFAQIPP